MVLVEEGEVVDDEAVSNEPLDKASLLHLHHQWRGVRVLQQDLAQELAYVVQCHAVEPVHSVSTQFRARIINKKRTERWCFTVLLD